MLKKVKLKIESTIYDLGPQELPEGEPEKTVLECFGSLFITYGRTSITYTENSEGGSIRSEIICLNGQVTVIRSGAIESELCFVEGETHHSMYSIPPYKFDAAVEAKRVRVDINENEGTLDLLYNMEIGGVKKAARMKIWISQVSNQT